MRVCVPTHPDQSSFLRLSPRGWYTLLIFILIRPQIKQPLKEAICILALSHICPACLPLRAWQWGPLRTSLCLRWSLFLCGITLPINKTPTLLINVAPVAAKLLAGISLWAVNNKTTWNSFRWKLLPVSVTYLNIAPYFARGAESCHCERSVASASVLFLKVIH